uniref:Uncharacterized protein n=1 Tax=Arundo donax TaxID=35708 RepID=A0A0A8YLF2_ARUDO
MLLNFLRTRGLESYFWRLKMMPAAQKYNGTCTPRALNIYSSICIHKISLILCLCA